MFPAWAVVHNAHFVPIFFSAGGVNASAGVLLPVKVHTDFESLILFGRKFHNKSSFKSSFVKISLDLWKHHVNLLLQSFQYVRSDHHQYSALLALMKIQAYGLNALQ